MTPFPTQFKIYKKTLRNGLTILAKPSHHMPRVEAHLWYNVGSKDEGHRERGMAHLLEHMLFKGTKNLSESDINMVCQKLTGDANAFTSQDYTCYTFKLPSHVWHVSLEILAECMQNATFNEQMLASELKAVIEELRMYKEDFQGSLIEHMVAAAFPEHPYHNPIIGSKFDLCTINRDDLYAFYKKHYHPGNAVLVVTGDVTKDAVFEAAERYFDHIPAATNYTKDTFFVEDDLAAHHTVLYRPVSNIWYSYLYKVPGFGEGQNHLLDIASTILATGKSSRLYQRLVNKEKVAVDVDCTVYDFFDKGIICIGVWPTPNQPIELIESLLEEEISALCARQVLDWEFEAAKKRTQVDFTSLLESPEKQAFVIGNAYLATQDAHFIENYLTAISTANKKDLLAFYKEYFSPSSQQKGYLLPVAKNDLKRLERIQIASDELEHKILSQHVRTTPVEPARWANRITTSPVVKFTYPKPKTYILKNGLEVIYHHNPLVPQAVCVLNFKANHLYETADLAGGFGFLLRTITDSTKAYDADAFAKLLDSEGIYLGAGIDNIAFKCLSADMPKAFKILAALVKEPTFRKETIEKTRQQLLSEIDEFWNNPTDFIDQLAKDVIYAGHPYQKNPLGTPDSIKKMTKKDLETLFKDFISPQEAVLVIVGDLSGIELETLISKHFNDWNGPHIADLSYPLLPKHTPQFLSYPINREQTVLGFLAPSISRLDNDYNALALLDIILTGGSVASPSSRLFQLREKTGLFYAIGGSLIYGSREEPGMAFIKTIVATDKVELAQKLILQAIDDVGKNGINQEDFEMAKNILFASSVELFESNAQMAQTFLFLKKLQLSFNLFDKQSEILSILKMDQVNQIAKRYCNKNIMTVMQIGRIKSNEK